jgi:hypothetical protein
VDPDLLAGVATSIRATWGGDTTMVRFRSSSNAEDSLEFSGAGLYDSVSGCLADEEDGDAAGPSRCDAGQDEERPVSDALRTVWASLWNRPAWEERAWYGIDQGGVAMGVLVDTRVDDERANMVAFTGNPTADDDRYLVNSQAGEVDVVSTEPGVWPEQVLLTVEGGAVRSIDRVVESSEVDPGEEVLTDAQYSSLGALLWNVAAVFPVDDEVPAGSTLLLDTEWKLLSDGRLVVKQVRPFLR